MWTVYPRDSPGEAAKCVGLPECGGAKLLTLLRPCVTPTLALRCGVLGWDNSDLPVYYEPVKDNVYLEDFYKDMKKCTSGVQHSAL